MTKYLKEVGSFFYEARYGYASDTDTDRLAGLDPASPILSSSI
jgi:hypothetical protein